MLTAATVPANTLTALVLVNAPAKVETAASDTANFFKRFNGPAVKADTAANDPLTGLNLNAGPLETADTPANDATNVLLLTPFNIAKVVAAAIVPAKALPPAAAGISENAIVTHSSEVIVHDITPPSAPS